MDLQPFHHQEATSSSTFSQPPLYQQSESSPENTSPPPSTELKPLRSSARVKAAKQKEHDKDKASKESDSAEQPSAASSDPPRVTRSTSQSSKNKRSRESLIDKGKARETIDEFPPRASKRARRATISTIPSSSLIIDEPTKDTKGKKRAAPEGTSEEESTIATVDSSSSKRIRSTAYSLRSRTEINSPSPSNMTRKTKPSVSKGKIAAKSKGAVPAGSSRVVDDDVEMMDVEGYRNEGSDFEDQMEGCDDDDIEDHEGNDGDANEQGNDQREGLRAEGEDSSPPVGARGFGGLDEPTAMAIFGDYRQFGSYMMSLSGRLKTMLNNIKSTANPTTRLVTLQELSELLSISTEDTLAGSFQVEQFVKELVKILGGRGVDGDDDDEGGEDVEERDEDAALAAALALSAGGATYQGDENLEAQVLACRCLANLMEALPGVAHTVVYHGAIPVLCHKLIEISYIDLAEQTLSTLEKISEEFPSSIVREGGLSALLNYLDFFSIAVQRTALQAASNCCRNVSAEQFPMIRGVWPIIRNCLGYADQRLVDYACLCVIRVIDSYYRTATENLESLLDKDTIKAINSLLMPAGGSPLVPANTYTLLVRALATAARASPKITVTLLQADIVGTLYQILTGVLPSASEGWEEQGGVSGGQGLGGGMADMTVMENLANRPKDQIEEALGLVSELMPPLPKDGVFDHKAYTDKALARMIKAKAKADRAAARQLAAAAAGFPVSSSATAASTPASVQGASASESHQEASVGESHVQEVDETGAINPPAEQTVDRTELLRSQPEVVGRFMQLIVPILIDVYAASVSTPVRVKTLTGLLKAVGFLEGDALRRVFNFVPVASFASSILSSKDHPSLVIGALQLVDLLLTKVSTDFKPEFRREGVFHEIEQYSARPLNSTKSKDKDKDKDLSDAPSPADTGNIPIHTSATVSSASVIPGFKKLSSLSLDPDDAITLRARVISFKHLSAYEQEHGDNAFEALRLSMEQLSAPNASEQSLRVTLSELADLFASPRTSVSSFELLQSGAVDGLLQFTTDPERSISVKKRQELLYDAFTSRKSRGTGTVETPFAMFVRKLQESLTRMECFEVVTITQGIDDSKRSSPSLLARQLRLRLTAEDDSDIPRNLHNIVVSIHAIATFQALNDYLRPRVAGLMPSGRLSGMLAALAASGFGPASSSRAPVEGQKQPIKTTPPAAGEGGAGATPAIERRRSLRLSAKNGKNEDVSGTAGTEASGDTSQQEAQSSAAAVAPTIESSPPSSALPSLASLSNDPLVHESGYAAEFTDDEVDAEVFDEDDDGDHPAEKTVTLSIAPDGTNIEAQTPEGTRVATPNSSKDTHTISTSRQALSNRTSYAAALKAKPSDWHLEFSMDDHALPLDLTIYGAIHQHEARKKQGAVPSSLIWQGVYTVKFKKVTGPPPENDSFKNRSPSPAFSSLPEDAPHTKILRLLRVLHKLNGSYVEGPLSSLTERRSLSEATFINNKLTAKLTRQLEEPMIVASSCLPDWAIDLPQNFPFLFPFATRYNFLQSTSFGYARLILKWQSQQHRGQDSSRRDEGIGFLGRLQRQKVRISRKHILESAVKVFELYGSSSSVLEVEYFEEVGTGLGPTLEFYSLVSKEFARRDLKIWRDADPTYPGNYVHHPAGLYPAPISPDDIANDGGQKRTHIFSVIGQFLAKAMLDSRIIDISFNKIFVKLVLGEEVPVTIATLKLVDSELANSLHKLQDLASLSGPTAKGMALDTVHIEDLALDFTIPGYDIELRPDGRNMQVTSDNAHEYIHEVLEAIVGKGVQLQAKAFREGFSKVFPISDLQTFSPDELVMLFGNSDEDWSIETLSESIKADHGFNVESRAIRDLIELMSEFDATTRRDYLQFITGSPKLPIGGFRGLNPPFTVVRKPHEAPLTADHYLPSVMTCVNYLKLPEYSSKKVMREKVYTAMKEGVGSFHLS